jgi:hypothetical protein
VPISTVRDFVTWSVVVNNIALVSRGIGAVSLDLHVAVIMSGIFPQQNAVAWTGRTPSKRREQT